jgi:hypothetical protein
LKCRDVDRRCGEFTSGKGCFAYPAQFNYCAGFLNSYLDRKANSGKI